MKAASGPMRRGHGVRGSVRTLLVVAVAALVLFAINESVYRQSTRALTHLGDGAEARAQIQSLWRSIIEAETGQRGYLITGREEYLQPYQNATATARSALQWLGRHYAADPGGTAAYETMAARSLDKLSELATTLELHDKGRGDAWRELMLTDIGRERMDGLRQASQQLLELENARVSDDRGGIFSTLGRARLGVHAMMALTVVAVWLYLRQARNDARVRRERLASRRAHRDRLKAEVARRTAELTDLTWHLQTAREEEKSHLARELHDELGALLTAAKLDAARLKHALGDIPPDVQLRLRHLDQSINSGIELKRRIIEELRPSTLSNLGLTAALEILVRELAARSEMRISHTLETVALSDSAQITVYRLVQEALGNALRHAAATQIAVTLKVVEPAAGSGAGRVHVLVQDNGRGFDPALRRSSSLGLLALRYRLEAEGGEMALHSAPGGGTRVEAWLPLLPPQPQQPHEVAQVTA